MLERKKSNLTSRIVGGGGGNSSRSHAVWENVATWSPELLLIGPIRGETDGTPETGQNAPWVSRRRSPSDAEVGPVFILRVRN